MIVAHAVLWFVGVSLGAIGAANYARVLIVEASPLTSREARTQNHGVIIRHGISMGLAAAAFIVNGAL